MNSLPTRPVYIYASPKINPICVKENFSQLHRLGVDQSRTFSLKDPSSLQRTLKEEKKGVLILPGGKTFSIHVELMEVFKEIREAVDRGWNAMGQCAGANLMSRKYSVIDQELGPSPILVSEDCLNLLPIEVITPALPPKKELSNFDANWQIAPIETAEKATFESFWNEGGAFHVLEPGPELKITALYQATQGIAAARGLFGKGRVVIQGIHPEIPLPDQRTPDDREKFQESDASRLQREDFMKETLSYLGIID